MRDFEFRLWNTIFYLKKWAEPKASKPYELFTEEGYLKLLNVLERDAKAEMKRRPKKFKVRLQTEITKYRKEKRRIRKKLKSPG